MPLPKPAIEHAIDSPARQRLPLLLRRAWYSLNQSFRRCISHLDITPDQFTVLRTLLEGDPQGLTQRELTQTMSSDPNTMTSLVERMEKAGLIERGEHESDRRAYRIRVRALGKRKFEKARLLALELQGEALSVLPASRRESFLDDLTLVADACREACKRKK